MAWIFGDVTKNDAGELRAIVPGLNKTLDWWTGKNLGHIVVLGPREAHTKLNLTGPPGMCSGVYFSLCFQLRKWDMQVHKASEEIEVSPVHAQYYQLTMKQKEELEAKIKSGLASAAQAISDYELLRHDERKYREFKKYYETKDEHSLRAVFIDQVDVHTGEGISMRSIISRWPTLISDFLRLTPEDTDPDKVKSRLNISKAEAIVLVTKNKLYNEWKEMFIKEVNSRLERIEGLIRSREVSINEYREWLKPYVTRFKMLEQAFESPERRKAESTSFMRAGGHAISTSRVRLWVWKDFQPTELKRMSPELMAEKPIKGGAYDDWLKENVIFHPKWGLVAEYPWIAGKMPSGKTWADETAEWIMYDSGWMVPHRLYYGFLEITFDRTNMRSADGREVEDGVWDVNALMMSQNALLAKLLELKAKQETMERYIDNLLGIKPKPEAPEKIETPKKRWKPKLPWGMMAFRPGGPYERMLEERLTKYYAKAVAETLFVPTCGFLKEKFGFGRP
ncbi:MAG: hypothetical protein QW548_00220 [Candidatus Aenigmatarchaeota archaeon]